MPETLSPEPVSHHPETTPAHEELEKVNSPDNAYRWYLRRGTGDLTEEVTEKDLTTAARKAAQSRPELRDRTDGTQYERHLERLIAAASMFTEASMLHELTTDEPSYAHQRGLEKSAGEILLGIIRPESKNKPESLQALDELYRMQAELYLADLQERQAARLGRNSAAGNKKVAKLALQNSSFAKHHPEHSAEAGRFQGELATYFLLKSWSKQPGYFLSVRKAFPREAEPVSSLRREQGAGNIVVTREEPSGPDTFLVQSEIVRHVPFEDAAMRTNEDKHLGGKTHLARITPDEIETTLKTAVGLAHDRPADQTELSKVRRAVVRRTGLEEAIRLP